MVKRNKIRELAIYGDYLNLDLTSVKIYTYIHGVTGKFGLGMWNEAGQRLIKFCQENALVIANTFFQQHKRRHVYTAVFKMDNE